jgi:YVTN family beta-propeller protein
MMTSRRKLPAYLLALATALAFCAPVAAQTPLSTVSVGASPRALVVNPVTNKTYIAQHDAGSVRVINNTIGTFVDVDVSGVGPPTTLAVDPSNGRVVVGTEGGVAFIDGSSDALIASGGGESALSGTLPAVIAGVALIPNSDPTLSAAILTDSANNSAWWTTLDNVHSAVMGDFACPGPVAANPVTGKYYVANKCGNSLTIFTGSGTGHHNYTLHANPVALAVNPVTNQIYVLEAGTAGVEVIDGALEGPSTPFTGFTSPTAIAVNPATGLVYVVDGNGAMTVISGANNTIVNITFAGTNPVGLTIDSVRNQVYVVNPGDGTVAAIDGAADTAARTLFTGASSNLITVNPLTSRVYAASTANSTLTTIDGRAYTTSTFPLASAVATAVNPITRRAYIAIGGNPGALSVISEPDDSVVTTVTVGAGPNHIAVDPALNRVYTSNSTDGTVSVLDAGLNTVIATVTVAANPGAIVVNPLTSKVYVAHPLSGQVSVIDGTNLAGTPVVVTVAGTPVALALDMVANKIYLGDGTGNAHLQVIDGATNGLSSLLGPFPDIPKNDVAVNPVTGRIYAASTGAGVVQEYDASAGNAINNYSVPNPMSVAVNTVTNRVYSAGGSSLWVIDPTITSVTSVALPQTDFVAVDEYADRIIVSGDGGMFVVDGETGQLTLPAAGSTGATSPGLPAVDPSTGKAYMPTADPAALVLKEATPVTLAFHGIGGVSVPGPVGSSTTLGVTTCCDYTPANPAVITTNAALDDLYMGNTTSAGSNLFSVPLTGITPGLHFVTLFPVDTMTGSSINTQSGSSGGTSVMIGRPMIFPLLTTNPLQVTTGALAVGTEAVAYAQVITATGGTGGYTFSYDGGTLPLGFSITSSGIIHGTPGPMGTYNFTVAVVDSSGNRATAPLSLTIGPGTPVLSITSSVDFGSAVINVFVDQDITLTNTGWGQILWENATISGTNAGDFAVLLAQVTCDGLTHGQSCVIPVRFAAGGLGSRSATADIQTDYAPMQHTLVPLMGIGLPPTFTLTTAVDGNGTGSIASDPVGIACPVTCSHDFATNSSVTLFADNDGLSTFDHWTGCDSVTGNQCTVTMSGSRSATATFTALVQYSAIIEGFQEVPYVNTTAHGSAAVIFNPVTNDLTVQWDLVNLTGTFTGVTVNGPAARGANAAVIGTLSTSSISGNNHIPLTPSQVTALQAGQLYINATTTDNPNGQIRGQIDGLGSAVFWPVNVIRLGTGNGTVIGTTEAGGVIVCGSVCAAGVPDGKVITFTNVPTSGSIFAGWGGACSGTGACQVTMNATQTVQATFNLSAGPTTTLAASATTIALGGNLTLTATLSGASGTPTGSVIFQDGVAPLATVPVDGTGHAVYSTTGLGLGLHGLSVKYLGDSTYGAVTSAPVGVNVVTPDALPRLGAISTRMQVLTGDNVLIGGFIVGGSTPKTVVVRARGPSLASAGISNFLANPLLQLVFGDGTVLTNDDWQSAGNAADIQASGFAPADAHESAILVTLQPGPYTAIVSGSGGGTGVGLVEVFEVDHPENPMAGISTRGFVSTGDGVMIGGIIIQGDAPQTVIVRARGPSLASQGVANPLANPLLQLVASDGTVLANDDWQSAGNAAQIQSSGFAPADPRESAILVTLNPGAYTAIVSGVGGATGVGLVEVFAVSP